MEILYITIARIAIRPDVVHAAKSAGRAKTIDIVLFRVHIDTVRWTHVKFKEVCAMEKILRVLEIIIGSCLVVFGTLALLKLMPVNVVIVFTFINLGVILLHSIISSIHDKGKNE